MRALLELVGWYTLIAALLVVFFSFGGAVWAEQHLTTRVCTAPLAYHVSTDSVFYEVHCRRMPSTAVQFIIGGDTVVAKEREP